MIVCPNCNHQNPDGAVQCEACYTPLPAMTTCPNCSASVQADASFCGQCGFNLRSAALGEEFASPPSPATISPDLDLPELPVIEPLVQPDPLPLPLPDPTPAAAVPPPPPDAPDVPDVPDVPIASPANPIAAPLPPPPVLASPPAPPPVPPSVNPPVNPPVNPAVSSPAAASKTQLQTQVARLLHVQTNTTMEIPASLTVVHIGKPNDRVPPDVDVSGFPNSEIVSRIHADIRVEGDAYYIEDVGSSNGTYINNTPLPPGNRHRLRSGDRIALGKGDKVSFLFQLA